MASAFDKASGDFEELELEGLQPSTGEFGGSKSMETEQDQERVSQSVELKSKGVGLIAVAGQSIAAKIALELFDAILTLASAVVAVINFFGAARTIGDDIAQVGPQGADFDLDHDAALLVPTSGSMAKAIEETDRDLGAGVFTLGLFEPGGGFFLED